MSRNLVKSLRASGLGRRLLCACCGRSLGDYLVDEPPGGPADGRVFTTLRSIRLPDGMLSWDGTGARPAMFFKVEKAAVEPPTKPGSVGFIPPKYRWRCSCGAGPVIRSDTLTSKAGQGLDIVV